MTEITTDTEGFPIRGRKYPQGIYIPLPAPWNGYIEPESTLSESAKTTEPLKEEVCQ